MDKELKPIPTVEEFCLKIPLYDPINLKDVSREDIRKFISSSVNFDCYCVDCEKDSVFTSYARPAVDNDIFTQSNIFSKTLYCSRSPGHKIQFVFKLKGLDLLKIGQFPSHADLSELRVKKYEKVLGKEDLSELKRGLGLASHGVGIGAFAYLRRVFEKLIAEAQAKAFKEDHWCQETYDKSRMSEKIELLKHHLPEFLVKQKALYGILSKGIHELSEKECLDAFPVVQLGIELILDEQLEKKRKEEKIKDAEKAITDLKSKHS